MTNISVGDKFSLHSPQSGFGIGHGSPFTLKKGTQIEIKRLSASGAWLRGLPDPNLWPYRSQEVTVPVYFDDVNEFATKVLGLPEDPNAPKPRSLGEKPQDTDELTYIGIDHPGIQWLFEDMGKYADQKGYCAEYDKLVSGIGIPGRPKNFKVSRTINGFAVTRTYKARSKTEAEKMFEKDLLEADIANSLNV